MNNTGWRFPPLSGGPKQGYTNNDIEAFKGQDVIDNLAREICQNSLDAVDSADAPVKVVFESMKIKKDNYPLFSEYQECLDGCRRFWGDEMDDRLSRFLAGADEAISQDEITLLVASDYNTKGLDGSRNERLKTPWEALTSSDGVSVKNDEDSAGSYGIGKNAPFACSSLSMVFYNTLASDGESAFIGVARVATLLNKEGKATQRVGKYQVNNDEEEEWNPIFAEDENSFRDLFRRDSEKGTDVIIAGFNQENKWVDNVTKAVLKNFFVAISERKLIVELRDGSSIRIIDCERLPELFAEYENDPMMVLSSQLYSAFITPDAHEFLEVKGPNDVEVYIKADASYRRTVANFRSTGMLVGTYSKRIFQHYAAVVVVRGKELGELLKDTEPPRHNRWDYKLIPVTEKDKRKDAHSCIVAIEDKVLSLLKNQFENYGDEAVDAVGVGEFLPDNEDALEGTATGEDILKAKIKIGKVKTVSQKNQSTTVDGKKSQGSEKPGDVHNREDNPVPPPPKPWTPPKPVNPDDTDSKQHEGVVSGQGTKSMIIPEVSSQRAFPISAMNGLYKIIVVPTKSYEKLYVSCSAVGEDGKRDSLSMESFTFNGKAVRIVKGVAGPISVEEGKPAIFFAKFPNKEKMLIKLQLQTEVTK